MACRTAVILRCEQNSILDLPAPGNLPVTFSQLAKKQKADQLPAGTLNEIHISKIKNQGRKLLARTRIVFLQIFSQSDRGHP